MRFPARRSAIFVAVAFCIAPFTSDAQLIRINNNGFGGVNIRAPFVRVNTSPYGTHVRAPFVEVNSPPPAYYQPPYYAPAAPFYQPAPGRPYYRVPANPGVVNGVPNSSQMGPRFNPTRPGEQSQRLGTAPAVPPKNGQRVISQSPSNIQPKPAQVVEPPAAKANVVKTPKPSKVIESPSQQGKLQSVLQRNDRPPVEQMEELPPPKTAKDKGPAKR